MRILFLFFLNRSFHSFINIKNTIFFLKCIYIINLINYNGDKLLEEFLPFIGLIIFGNIENLILASQGVVQGVNPRILGGLSIICVIVWLTIGTVATEVAIQYANIITFIGGLAIVILGIQSVQGAVKNIKAAKGGENNG